MTFQRDTGRPERPRDAAGYDRETTATVAQEGDITEAGAMLGDAPPHHEEYLDIVWRQFKKNRAALAALWLMVPMFLVAIFAPAIASNQPFVYQSGSETIYPWFRALFNMEDAVDFAFNMALIAFFPCLLAALVLNLWAKHRRVPGRRRLGWSALLYLTTIVLLCAIFSIDTLRPANLYGARTFPEEQFAPGNTATAWYPPIPFGANEQDIEVAFQPPLHRAEPEQWKDTNDRFPHLLGTDNVGRDVLVRMIYGSRISLTVGFVAVGIYITIGVIVGALAGYFGGFTDIAISRIIEIVLLFPSFFLILTLVAMLGRSIYIIMVIIGITGWPTMARLIRGEFLKQRAIDYVAAARSLGASNFRIIFRHILPNALSPALVAIPFGVAGAIITEAGLSLLGFGVEPPTPSWGSLLQLAHNNYSYWWLVVVPSLAMFVTVTAFNVVGSGLRDAMDPRLRV